MSNPSAQPARCPHANLVAIAAVVGAPYIAVRRHWNAEKRIFEKDDDGSSRTKASYDGKQEALAGGRSVAEILRGDSRELTKLRDAVK